MTLADEYRGYAAECLRIAQQVSDPDLRLHLTEMAQRWLELADRTEQPPEKGPLNI
jgi:hypothetical protein